MTAKRFLVGGSLALSLVLIIPLVGGHHHLGDSGELATVIANLGIAHPPGYPAYTLLGHLFGRGLDLVPGTPRGDWVLFCNLFSSFWFLAAVLAAAVLLGLASFGRGNLDSQSSSGRDRRRRLFLSLAGVLFLASQPSLLRAAVVTEVYTMHLGLHAVTWLLLAWEIRRLTETKAAPNLPWLATLGLVTGLGCVHHLTYVLVLPVSGAVLLRGLSRVAWKGRFERLAVGGGGLAIGLASVLYLPWRIGQNPLMNWGRLDGEPTSIWQHISAAQYNSKLGNPLHRESLPTLSAVEAWSLAGALVACLLATGWWVRTRGQVGEASAETMVRRRIVGWLLVQSALVLVFVLVYEIQDIVDYVPPLGWNLGVAAALALSSSGWRPIGRRLDPLLVPVVVAASVTLAISAFNETSRGLHVERATTSNLVAMWRSLPDEESVIVHQGDTIGVLYYLKYVARENESLVPFNPLTSTLGSEAMREEYTAAKMVPVVLYDAEAFPDPQSFLADQSAVAKEILRDVSERSPLPLYFFDPLQGKTLKRAQAPKADYVELLRAAGQLPADADFLPRAEVQRRVRELRLSRRNVASQSGVATSPMPAAGEED